MTIDNLLENHSLLNAEKAIEQANSDNIIELCKNHIQLLTEYRDKLYKLRGTPEINLIQSSSLAQELAEQTRKSVRAALEMTTQKSNYTESLLKSFTAISGYEAVNTFNQLEYKGFTGWELRANKVRLNDNELNIQEAVETASQLRREAYITHKTIFFTIL